MKIRKKPMSLNKNHRYNIFIKITDTDDHSMPKY